MRPRIPSFGNVRVAAILGAFVLSTLLATGSAIAQDATPTVPTSAGGPTITVVGHGAVMVPPDAASVTAGVTITEDTLSVAQSTANETMTAILAALEAQGIESQDIQTAGYYVQVIQSWDENGMPSGINQFQVSNTVNVTIRDIDAVGATLDAVVEAGANTIYGVNFIVTDSGEAADQARTLAVQDAQRRAEQLAAAAGMSLGDIVSISETFGPNPIPVAMGGAGGAAMESSVAIEAGSTTVSVDVQITWELAS
ncbi:MAG: SIMPL domain-containing protein [Thermomicrobiales bacterium]|nr:SIMPL domain-containing protein [Thermomicrobiales bacterium]